MSSVKNIGLALLLGAILQGCNVMKYVPDDEKLYTGAEVELQTKTPISGKNQLQYTLEDVVEPDPNSTIFGIRYGLYFHYKSQQQDAGKISKALNKRFGEEPVYLSDVNTSRTEKILENRCVNRGFFYPEISSSVDIDKRKASAQYVVVVSEPYSQETYVYQGDSSRVDSLIKLSMDETLLDKGNRFNTEDFKSERTRIDDYLKNRGYYEFNPDFLIFTTDTNQYDERKFDLYLSFKQAAPSSALRPYRFNKINAYPNYSLEENDSLATDSVMVDEISIIQEGLVFKPRLLRQYITLRPGELYDKRDVEITNRRLSSLGTFQIVTIRHERVDTNDRDHVGKLKTSIFLSPAKKQALRLEVQTVTKSTSFAGPGLIGSYKNQNLFKGGERLEISGNISYETQLGGEPDENLSTFEFALNNSITFPRLVGPIKINSENGYIIPRTKFSLDYTLQRRAQYYNLNSFLFSYGVNWKSNRFLYYEINPISVNFTSVTQKTPEFEEILNNNPFLARSFEDQFITGLTGTIQYSELGEADKKNKFYINLGGDFAGNTLGLIQSDQETGDKEIFGLPYAQYLRLDVDFRHYINLFRKSRLASRLFTGVGYPYGNSLSLPFVKQYFSGGPNSIRAFRVRSVGPGSYQPPDTVNLSFFDQAGDIRLETNVEFRHPLVSLLKGAVFVDAGNVWLWNDNPAIPGGQFSDSWTQEIAIGYGYGFRLDIQFLVIRLDLSVPLRYPYEKNGSHWESDYSFGQKDWRKQNLIWNFAIGYPF